MAQGKASTREIATAHGVLAGKTVSQAMRDAGYAETTARTRAGRVESRLRDLGLLPTPEVTQDAIAMLNRVIFEDKGKALEQVYRVALSQAQAGDDKARRFVMSYLAGLPSQAVQVSGPGGGPVETVTRVVFEWADDDSDTGAESTGDG